MKRKKDKRKDHSQSVPETPSSPTLGSLFSDVFAKAKSTSKDDATAEESSDSNQTTITNESPASKPQKTKEPSQSSRSSPPKTNATANKRPQNQVPSAKTSKQFAKPKWRVELSTKGRRGKTVTLVSGVKDLEQHRKILQSRLGTGAHIEGDTLVIRGDQRKALENYIKTLKS